MCLKLDAFVRKELPTFQQDSNIVNGGCRVGVIISMCPKFGIEVCMPSIVKTLVYIEVSWPKKAAEQMSGELASELKRMDELKKLNGVVAFLQSFDEAKCMLVCTEVQLQRLELYC